MGPSPTPTYQPFGYEAQYTAPTNNGFAIASLVLGILCLYGIGSVLALIFGYKARREIDESRGRQKGRGMATAGVVLGWIGVALVAFLLVAVVLVGTSSSSSTIH
jgi:hypothetical protein